MKKNTSFLRRPFVYWNTWTLQNTRIGRSAANSDIANCDMGQAIAYPKHGWLNTKQWSMFVEPVSLDLTNDHTVFLENGGPQNRGFPTLNLHLFWWFEDIPFWELPIASPKRTE